MLSKPSWNFSIREEWGEHWQGRITWNRLWRALSAWWVVRLCLMIVNDDVRSPTFISLCFFPFSFNYLSVCLSLFHFICRQGIPDHFKVLLSHLCLFPGKINWIESDQIALEKLNYLFQGYCQENVTWYIYFFFHKNVPVDKMGD